MPGPEQGLSIPVSSGVWSSVPEPGETEAQAGSCGGPGLQLVYPGISLSASLAQTPAQQKLAEACERLGQGATTLERIAAGPPLPAPRLLLPWSPPSRAKGQRGPAQAEAVKAGGTERDPPATLARGQETDLLPKQLESSIQARRGAWSPASPGAPHQCQEPLTPPSLQPPQKRVS